jgi:hypothetical protein
VCEPAPGSVDNLHSHKPWLATTRRKLQPIGSSIDRPDYYQYRMTANDSLAAVAGELMCWLSRVSRTLPLHTQSRWKPITQKHFNLTLPVVSLLDLTCTGSMRQALLCNRAFVGAETQTQQVAQSGIVVTSFKKVDVLVY